MDVYFPQKKEKKKTKEKKRGKSKILGVLVHGKN